MVQLIKEKRIPKKDGKVYTYIRASNKKQPFRIDEVIPGESESKLDRFVTEFKRNGGKAADAAKAIGYEGIGANLQGGNYLARAKQKGLVRDMAEKHAGLEMVLKEIWRKALSSDNPAFIDRMIKALGYENEIIPGKNTNTTPGVINIIQTQKNQQDEFGFVEGQEIKEKKSE